MLSKTDKYKQLIKEATKQNILFPKYLYIINQQNIKFQNNSLESLVQFNLLSQLATFHNNKMKNVFLTITCNNNRLDVIKEYFFLFNDTLTYFTNNSLSMLSIPLNLSSNTLINFSQQPYSWNTITFIQQRQYHQIFSKFTSCRMLDLGFNQLDEFQNSNNLSTLKQLYLNDNNFSHSISADICSFKFKFLLYIDLRNNKNIINASKVIQDIKKCYQNVIIDI